LPTSIWSGTISFGLVSIPVRLEPATTDKSVHFHELHAGDGSRVQHRIYCEACGERLEPYEIVRGYEVSRGRYVAITDDDLASIPLKSLHAIEIERFVKLEQVDPILFTKTYYLEPEELGLKPFALLWRVMTQTGKAAVGTFTLRNKEHVCVLRPFGPALALSPLLYQDEVRSTEPLRTPSERDVPIELLTLGKSYVEALTTTPFVHDKYSDSYRAAVEAICSEKAESPLPPEGAAPRDALPDLMEALRNAVEKAQKSQGVGTHSKTRARAGR
jgi:DNA end-binding protein Ku